MGLTRKDIQNILKPLRHKAEESFTHIRMAFAYLYDDEVEGERVDLPKGLSADEFEATRPVRPQPEAVSCLGVKTNQRLSLANIMQWRRHTSVFLVDCRAFQDKRALTLSFWRAFSTAMDLEAYLNMMQSRKERIPDFLKEQDFNKSVQSSLRTDLFSALLMAFDSGSLSGLHAVFRDRANAPFHRSHMGECEKHPCVMAYDAALFAYESTIETLDHFNPCKSARRLSIDIVKGFDPDAYTGWRDFAMPARDMSLRGYPIPTILSGALSVTDKPHIRSVAHNCAILLDCEGILDQPEELEFNAFDTDQSNLIKHEQYAKKLFEKALYEAKKRASTAPLHEEANRQNLRLTQGRISGWCADILQRSAEEFDQILRDDENAHVDQLPKSTDYQKSSHDHYRQWASLKQVCDMVTKRKLQGQATTLAQIVEADSDDDGGGMEGIKSSVKATMTNPAYLAKLEAANRHVQRQTPDFKVAPNAPSVSPQAAPTLQQAPVPTPFGTGMRTQKRPQNQTETHTE